MSPDYPNEDNNGRIVAYKIVINGKLTNYAYD